jgi:undecaprenyl-diphosphatase
MNAILAAILGLVEGLTEFLPVSSTGHLTLASHFLRVPKEQADVFDVVIQFGAILAVAIHYRALLSARVRGLFAKEKRAVTLALSLVIGFLPIAVFGVLFRKVIKKHLLGPYPVAITLAAGGLFMIAMHLWFAKRPQANERELDDLTVSDGWWVGLGQCFALVPGMSRSMSSMIAGRFAGLSASAAAEFSFLLGLPTLGAACIYEGYKDRTELMHIGMSSLGIGMLVSFLAAWAVVATFLKLLSKVGLWPFGVYRVILAIVTVLALAK